MKINILEIMKHRYPFLLIDKVIDFDYLKSANVIKNVSYNEPWVQGHYPNHPIMPGVLLIEAMGQASAFITVDFNSEEIRPKYGYLIKVDNVKFVRPVYPGDQIVITSKLIEMVDNYICIQSVCRVDDKVVAKCKLTYILKEENDEL